MGGQLEKVKIEQSSASAGLKLAELGNNTENLNTYNRRVVVASDALDRLLEVMSVGEALETL